MELARGLFFATRLQGLREKSYGGPDFLVGDVLAASVRCELGRPGEHSGIAYAAADDPEQLIIGLVGRMQEELQGSRWFHFHGRSLACRGNQRSRF
jgi:hypothetical protein